MSTIIRMTPSLIRQVQRRLNELREVGGPLSKKLSFGPLKEDGIRGRRTNAAIIAFKKSLKGFRHVPFIGRYTWEALFGDTDQLPKGPDALWMDEALRKMGLNESTNNRTLSNWLKLDGSTVGDPSKVPWCGDFVETALALTMSQEALPVNPYLAANWVKFGIRCRPQYGAIMSFWRGSPKSWKGHVAFYVAEDDEAYHVLGGNQNNSVSITRIDKSRLRPHGCRWPSTAMDPTGKPRRISPGSDPLSLNEA